MDGNKFTFNTPLYILGERDDITGAPERQQMGFVSRSMDGTNMTVVFTDESLAVEFLASLPANNLTTVMLPTLDEFRGFLRAVLKQNNHVMFNPNPKTRLGQIFAVKSLLDQLDGP